MSRQSWALTKLQKNFNVNVYRRGVKVLLVSVMINTFFALSLFYLYIIEPERDYYATNGITPPEKINSMPGPNMSSVALLAPDPVTDEIPKVIPQ